MTAEELWEKSGIDGEYDAWAFGDDADRLAELVKIGIKTATSSVKNTPVVKEKETEPWSIGGAYTGNSS